MTSMRSRTEFITSLRGLTAFYVMLSHIWNQIWTATAPPFGYSEYPEGLMATLTGWLFYSHFGVVVFIFISGFCLMMPTLEPRALDGGLWRYLKRRSQRILPPYYVALLLSALLGLFVINEKTGTVWDLALPVTKESIVSHVFLYHDFTHPLKINYTHWSVAAEFQLYLTFPILLWLWYRIGALPSFVILSVFTYCLVGYVYWMDDPELPPPYIGMFGNFFMGMAFCALFYHDRIPVLVRNNAWTLSAISTLSLVGLCAYFGHQRVEQSFFFFNILVTLITGLVFIGFYYKTETLQSFFLHERLLGLGRMSYSLYLIHAPLIHLIWFFFGLSQFSKNTQFLILLPVATVVCLIVSYAFYLAFEKPFIIRHNASKAKTQFIVQN